MSLQPPTREQVIAHHQAHGPVRIAGGNVRIGITIEGDPDALTAVEPMRVETDIPWRVLPHEVRSGLLTALLVWLTAGEQVTP